MVEIPGLGDPDARRIIAILAAIPKLERAGNLAPVYLLEEMARQYIERGGTVQSWRAYETTLGVPQSKTRQPKSLFQPSLRWANGGKLDTTGRLAKLAAPLDEWMELGDKRPSPITSEPGTSEFAEWLDESHGYTNVAERRRDENYSESECAYTAATRHDRQRANQAAGHRLPRLREAEAAPTPMALHLDLNRKLRCPATGCNGARNVATWRSRSANQAAANVSHNPSN